MSLNFTPATGALAALDLLRIEIAGAVAHIRLNRPAKRNAVNDTLIAQLHSAFVSLPEAVKAAVLTGEGDHFCAGLDLSELSERSVAEGVLHSRTWHAAMDAIQFGRVPVVAVLHGAVVGGGLELASSCHIRVAEESAYYGLPEGQRGIFVGGGGREHARCPVTPARLPRRSRRQGRQVELSYMSNYREAHVGGCLDASVEHRPDGSTVLRGRWDLVCIELSTGRPRRMPPEFVQVYGAAVRPAVGVAAG